MTGTILNRLHRLLVRTSALIYFISILIMGNGCVPSYYSSSAQNVPLFEEQFDANVLIAYRCGATAIGFDIQAALAVTDHIGIMANYNHFGLHWDYSDDFWGFGRGYHKGDLFEIGAGYFRPLKKKMMFETYGGFGWGGVKNNYEGSLEHNLYHRYFIQPALGWHINQKISLGVSARLCLIDYYYINYDENFYISYQDELLRISKNPQFHFDPAFTFRAGNKNVKFQAQALLSLNPGRYINNEELYYDPLNISLGLIFTIQKKK